MGVYFFVFPSLFKTGNQSSVFLIKEKSGYMLSTDIAKHIFNGRNGVLILIMLITREELVDKQVYWGLVDDRSWYS